jgi:hypothetical protein
MQFGIEESLGVSSEAMTQNLRAFLEQGDEWRAVEEQIAAQRDRLQREDPPGAVELERSAPAEVGAWLAAWQGDWQRALEFAREVIDSLRGGRAPQRYAALWNYLASAWSARLAAQTGDDAWLATSNDYMLAARASGRGTTWLSHLAAPADLARQPASAENDDPVDRAAAAAVVRRFEGVGRPSVFDEAVVEARVALEGREPEPYERALVFLGQLLGAASSEGDHGAHAAPDATWLFEETLWVCWEAKSDAEPDGELGATDVRQAGGHLRFVSSERHEPIPSGSVCVVVTPQIRIHPASVQIAEDHVFRVAPALAVDLFDRAVRAWRQLRARGTGAPSENESLSALRSENALPSRWLAEATSSPINVAL